MGLLGKDYKNVLILDNEKDAILAATKEHLGPVNQDFPDIYPVTMELPKKRTYLGAMKRSSDYSKMGIFNIVCKQD